MFRRMLLWILLTALVLALVLLVARHDQGTIAGLENQEFASLTIKITLLVFVGSSMIVMFRGRLGAAVRAALMWAAIAVVLLVGYTYRGEMLTVTDRVLGELVPGSAVNLGGPRPAVEITRGRGGSFQVTTEINGARVPMVLDTGASAVVLTQEAAKAAGLPLEVLSYTVPVETANGRTRAAAVTLDRLAIGGIVERAVPALVAQPGQLQTNLLGMSFLNRLESWEVRGDKLILRGYP